MNKAFVREPDDNGERHCPRCGSLATAVTAETIDAHLSAEARGQLADSGFYCSYPQCEVAYFDLFERIVTVEQLVGATFPKDPTAKICNCFGLSPDDIDQDISEDSVVRTRKVIEQSKSAEAHCLTSQPDGHSCVAEVQRYYMRNRKSR
ncbi:MAG: hypothetical protein SGJ20_13655 [Planctomycetota bacterium]|nr:hypothetical protein [Planctomycetota bacterium]